MAYKWDHAATVGTDVFESQEMPRRHTFCAHGIVCLCTAFISVYVSINNTTGCNVHKPPFLCLLPLHAHNFMCLSLKLTTHTHTNVYTLFPVYVCVCVTFLHSQQRVLAARAAQ